MSDCLSDRGEGTPKVYPNGKGFVKGLLESSEVGRGVEDGKVDKSVGSQAI